MLLPSNLYDFGDKHFRLGIGRKDCAETLQLWEEYIVKSNSDNITRMPRFYRQNQINFFANVAKPIFDIDQLAGNDIHPVTEMCQSYFFWSL